MNKIKYLFLLLLIFLLVSGQGNDYYSRIDDLLGQTIEVMANANALPIITGVSMEQLTAKSNSLYYNTAAKLADKNNNFAWAAYQNSNKLSQEYYAKKTEMVAQDTLGSGEKAAFMDQISGQKYLQEEQRFKKEEFFKQFQKGIGSADIYIDNIGISEKLIKDLFEVELPDLPDSSSEGFEKQIPGIHVEPLEQWQNKIISAITNEDINNQLTPYWKIQLEPLNGNYKKISDRLLQLANFSPLTLGIKISNPAGNYITNQQDLGGLIPFITTLPLPEGENSKLNIFIEDNNPTFKKESFSSIPKGIAITNQNFNSVQPGKTPCVINYSLAKDIDIVEMNIYNNQGKKIYTLKESKPNPLAPIPFIWNGNYSSGKNSEPGNYTITLTGYDKNNTTYSTPPKILTVSNQQIKKEINLEAKKIINNGSGNYYSYLVVEPLSHERHGLEKIYVWLHGTENNFDKPISQALYTSMAQFDENQSSLTAEKSVFIGRDSNIRVILHDKNGNPIINAPLTLYSRRNNHKKIDFFTPESIRTNNEGVAECKFKSQIPGDVEIFALSDMLWINQKPLIIKVKNISQL